MTQTTNIGLKKIDGSENWRQIFDYHNDSADKTDSAVSAVQDGIAIVANGDTHAAVEEGQFVYVRNHSTLAEGLYKAASAIGTNGELTTSNLTADSSGGLNDLQEQITALNSKIGNIGGLIARNTTSGSTMSGTLDLANAHAVIAVINVHSVGDISMVIPLDGTQSVYGYIKYSDNFWASVKLQLTASNGQYIISFDAKGSNISTFDYAYFYRL